MAALIQIQWKTTKIEMFGHEIDRQHRKLKDGLISEKRTNIHFILINSAMLVTVSQQIATQAEILAVKFKKDSSVAILI